MSGASLPGDEVERLGALRSLGVLDTPPEERFDRITRLASRAFDVDIALVSLVDANRQWFKSCVGLPVRETPRAQSFCAHAILGDDVFVIPDAQADARFSDNLLVTGPPFIRFYAGKPLRVPTGHKVGTLCLIHTEPRDFSDRDAGLLEEFAVLVEDEFSNVQLKDALVELEHAHTRIEAVMHAAVEGIVELDRNGHVVYVNPAAAATLGYGATDLLGRELHALAHYARADGTPYPRGDCPTHRTLEGGGAFRSADELYWRSDGSAVPVELTTAPLIENGEVTGAVVTFSDITERRALDQMKDQFVSSVSHELRTPLTSIKGYIEAVAEGEAGEVNDEQGEFLSIAYRNAEKLESLINDLLLVSRMAAGAVNISREPVDLAALAGQLIEELRPAAEAKDLRVDADLRPARLSGDPARLHQAVANLMSNAVKFTPRGRAVRIRTDGHDGCATVEVADEGVGIPADELPRLMQRFFRASTASTIDGTGLGLTITREIVEAHGGEVTVESEVGRGSVFRIVLPAG